MRSKHGHDCSFITERYTRSSDCHAVVARMDRSSNYGRGVGACSNWQAGAVGDLSDGIAGWADVAIPPAGGTHTACHSPGSDGGSARLLADPSDLPQDVADE